MYLYWSLQCLYFLLLEDSIIFWPTYISPKKWLSLEFLRSGTCTAMIWNQKNGIKKWSPNVGLEPTTLRLRVSCSTNWASRDWWDIRDYRQYWISEHDRYFAPNLNKQQGQIHFNKLSTFPTLIHSPIILFRIHTYALIVYVLSIRKYISTYK